MQCHRLRIFHGACLWVLLPALAVAQSGRGKGWETSMTYSYGSMIRHTPKFQPVIEDRSQCMEFTCARQTDGRHWWQQMHHYPYLGIAAAYNDLGNDEVIGQAWSLLPFIRIPVTAGNHWDLSFRVGTGLAYLTRHYDVVENPTNNVIASHVNNITQFVFDLHWQPNQRFGLYTGVSATHYSTGAVRLPNLGINVLAGRIGFTFRPKPYLPENFKRTEWPPLPRTIRFKLNAGLGFQEAGAPDGPMYQVYLLEFSIGKMIKYWYWPSLGMQVNYKEAARAFINQEESYPDRSFQHALASSVFISNDFLFGNLGIDVHLGTYFYHPSPLQVHLYQRLGTYYSIPVCAAKPWQKLAAGVYLTAGDFTADFVSMEIGWRW